MAEPKQVLMEVVRCSSQCGAILVGSDIADVTTVTAEIPAFAKGGSYTICISEFDCGERHTCVDKEALTTFFKDSAYTYHGAPVFRDVGEGLWLHKEPQHTWRVGRALGGGDTLLTSAACAESPPICCWSGADQQHVETMVCIDTAVWAGLTARVLCTDLKAIREKTDDEAEAGVAQPARDDGAGVAVDDIQGGENQREVALWRGADVVLVDVQGAQAHGQPCRSDELVECSRVPEEEEVVVEEDVVVVVVVWWMFAPHIRGSSREAQRPGLVYIILTDPARTARSRRPRRSR